MKRDCLIKGRREIIPNITDKRLYNSKYPTESKRLVTFPWGIISIPIYYYHDKHVELINQHNKFGKSVSHKEWLIHLDIPHAPEFMMTEYAQYMAQTYPNFATARTWILDNIEMSKDSIPYYYNNDSLYSLVSTSCYYYNNTYTRRPIRTNKSKEQILVNNHQKQLWTRNKSFFNHRSYYRPIMKRKIRNIIDEEMR